MKINTTTQDLMNIANAIDAAFDEQFRAILEDMKVIRKEHSMGSEVIRAIEAGLQGRSLENRRMKHEFRVVLSHLDTSAKVDRSNECK